MKIAMSRCQFAVKARAQAANAGRNSSGIWRESHAAATEPAWMRRHHAPPGRWRTPSQLSQRKLLHQSLFLVVAKRARVVRKVGRIGRHLRGRESAPQRSADLLHALLALGDRLHVL